jgi:hypothetical protein
LFGTSAGALNAMWASTLNPETKPNKLLDNWFSLAMRISAILIYVPALLFGAAVGVLVWFNHPKACAAWAASFFAFCLFSVIPVLLLPELFMRGLFIAWSLSLATMGGVLLALGYRWSSIAVFVPAIFVFIAILLRAKSSASLLKYVPRSFLNGRRWPGLFRINWLARLLPRPEGRARFHVYMCTADVNLKVSPTEWDWNTLGVFHLKPGETEPNLEMPALDTRIDVRTAAMCSAGLPILCRPYEINQRHFLDGGLEANLPAGFLRQHGLLGGLCAICIIPYPVDELDPNDHIDYRTIRFLSSMKQEQAFHRGRTAEAFLQGETNTGPGHTHYPVLIVSPERRLASGLIDGFLQPQMLPPEFAAGRTAAQTLVQAMDAFVAGENEALNAFLLEHRGLPEPYGKVPRPGFWAMWANPQWLL